MTSLTRTAATLWMFAFSSSSLPFPCLFLTLAPTHTHVRTQLKEYLLMCGMTRAGTVEQRLEASFDLFDANGDGVLSKEEVRNILIMLVQQKMALARFQSTGRKTSPEREVLDPRTLASIDRVVETTFASVDTDHVCFSSLLSPPGHLARHLLITRLLVCARTKERHHRQEGVHTGLCDAPRDLLLLQAVLSSPSSPLSFPTHLAARAKARDPCISIPSSSMLLSPAPSRIRCLCGGFPRHKTAFSFLEFLHFSPVPLCLTVGFSLPFSPPPIAVPSHARTQTPASTMATLEPFIRHVCFWTPSSSPFLPLDIT